MRTPLLSVQIVTWNSAPVIETCLEALSKQQARDFEIILVDNASADGSADAAERWRDRLPHLIVRRELANRGFCGGQNLAFERSSAPWVLFLNPDAMLPPDFIERAIAISREVGPRVGAVAPCVMLPDGSVDSTGLTMDRFRRAYDRDRGAPAARREAAARLVLGCTGAVALLRRDMLVDVAVNGEVLDERIFAYYDDLDLAWRGALRGWTCRYEPSLVAVHGRAARNAIRGLKGRPTRGRDQLLSVRNRLLVMMRCDCAFDIVAGLPWLLPFEIARIGYLALRAPHALGAYKEAIQEARGAFSGRRIIRGRLGPTALRELPWRLS